MTQEGINEFKESSVESIQSEEHRIKELENQRA